MKAVERLCSSHEIIFRVNLLTRDMISSCGKNQRWYRSIERKKIVNNKSCRKIGNFLPLTCYWCPENFLLASYTDPYFVLKFSRRQCHCGFHCFPSQVIILYDENQRMESENGKLKIALQLHFYFCYRLGKRLCNKISQHEFEF